MEKVYYAKSKSGNEPQETVKDHLQKVSDLAGEYGAAFGQKEAAALAGMLHDFGKYSESFQNVLKGTCSGIDHALPGAAWLYKKKKKQRILPVMEAVRAHHSELKGFHLLEDSFKKSINNDDGLKGINALAGEEEYQTAGEAFEHDFPNFETPKYKTIPTSSKDKLENMLYTRMLFSCLVDADYTVSAQTMDAKDKEQTEEKQLNAQAALKSLYAYRDNLRKNSTSNPQLNKKRDELFEMCGRAGDSTEGLFTLTAPTGIGKTLALMHFALRQCQVYNKRRIIVVLPFLALMDSTVDVYETILLDVLEDHSQKNLEDDKREFAAKWNSPCIITTSVKFFEALFSKRPADCRKLHNISNSVILFDEAQSLPIDVTGSTLKAVNELCRGYNCSMVFSTATQPSFDARSDVSWKPVEICPDNAQLYDALRRTQIAWRIKEYVQLESIAAEMAQLQSVCCIVNLRSHARKLYTTLKSLCDDESVFYLTTDLCAAHRTHLLKEIKTRLANTLPCRLVATQCIEAGVDLDFDNMYRALAPLDAIIQAAGRCNRNGRKSMGNVIVFKPEDDKDYPGNSYRNAAGKVLQVLSEHDIDIHNPAHIAEYYERLFKESKDKEMLIKAIDEKDYDAVSHE